MDIKYKNQFKIIVHIILMSRKISLHLMFILSQTVFWILRLK